MTILVVDDEANIINSLKIGLQDEGYDVVTSISGEDAFFLLNSNSYELIILDWMLPGRSGIEILKKVREQGTQTPVLLLTAKDQIEDKVVGLDSGADDYLVKPFEFAELSARIRSLLRREQYHQQMEKIIIDNLEIDLSARTVKRNDSDIELTNKEYELLLYLGKNRGNTISRNMIAKHVWKIESRVTSMDGVIDVHMTRLRKKIDGPFTEKIITTVRGVGFRIEN